MAKKKGPTDLHPLSLASGQFLAKKPERDRLIGELKAHGLRIYRVAGREFVSEGQWQSLLGMIAEDVT